MNHTSRRHLPNSRPPPRLDEAWLRFLILEGLNDAEVNDRLASDDLPPATPAQLTAVRLTLNVPANFAPADGQHIATETFLYRTGIEVFFRRNGSAASEVLRLLRTPKAREVAEAALVVGVPLPAVSQVLAKYLGFFTDVATLATYGQVFLDVRCMTRSQLRAAIEQRVWHSIVRVVGDQDEIALRRAVASDGRIVAASVPQSPLAWSSVLLAFGWQPATANLANGIAELETLALVRAAEALARGGASDEQRLAGYVGVLERLHALRRDVRDPNETVTTAFATLRIAQSEEPVMTVEALLARGDEIGTSQLGPADLEEEDGSPESDPVKSNAVG